MKTSCVLSVLAAAGSAVAGTSVVSSAKPYATAPAPAPPSTNGTIGPDKDGKYEISAEGIRASFIPYGASITNLFVKDKNGIERDIVLGFDNASHYSVDKFHPHLGGVPGEFWDAARRRGHGQGTDDQQVVMRTALRTARSLLMVLTTTLRLMKTVEGTRSTVVLMAGIGYVLQDDRSNRV